MRQYAAVLEEVLIDSASAPDQVFSDLYLLPNGVVGMAFGATCARLTPERHKAVSTWISNQDQERSDTERTYAVPGLFRFSPADAFGALHSMRSSPTKEQRERLASMLSDVPAEEIASIFAERKEHEVRKVVLLILIAVQEPKSDRRTRSAVLEGVLPIVARLSLYKGSIGIDVRRHITGILKSLDEFSIKTIRESLSQKAPDALSALMAEEPSSSEPTNGDLRSVQPTGALQTPVVDERHEEREAEHNPSDTSQARKGIEESTQKIVADPLAWFDANIQMLAHAREFYLAVRAEAEAEHKRREELERLVAEMTTSASRVSAAESRIRELEQDRAESARKLESLTAALTAATQRLEEERQIRRGLESESTEAKEAFVRERDALQRRIDVNAEARVQDFRLAIAAALSPILRDVPPPGSQQAAELGPGLLICIDQIVRTLSEKGIALRRSAGEHS